MNSSALHNPYKPPQSSFPALDKAVDRAVVGRAYAMSATGASAWLLKELAQMQLPEEVYNNMAFGALTISIMSWVIFHQEKKLLDGHRAELIGPTPPSYALLENAKRITANLQRGKVNASVIAVAALFSVVYEIITKGMTEYGPGFAMFGMGMIGAAKLADRVDEALKEHEQQIAGRG